METKSASPGNNSRQKNRWKRKKRNGGKAGKNGANDSRLSQPIISKSPATPMLSPPPEKCAIGRAPPASCEGSTKADCATPKRASRCMTSSKKERERKQTTPSFSAGRFAHFESVIKRRRNPKKSDLSGECPCVSPLATASPYAQHVGRPNAATDRGLQSPSRKGKEGNDRGTQIQPAKRFWRENTRLSHSTKIPNQGRHLGRASRTAKKMYLWRFA